MFNFSANNIQLVNSFHYDRCTMFLVKDINTSRCYRLYDYSKQLIIEKDLIYKVSGKINSADKLYLILENVKPQNISNIQFSKSILQSTS